MKQKLRDGLTAAMKSGDKPRTMVLRGVLAEVSRWEVEKDVRRPADEGRAEGQPPGRRPQGL